MAAAARSIAARASARSAGSNTTGTPALMIPAFSAAIASIVGPRISA